MTTQPEALRLAQELDAYHTRSAHKEAAIELRRLHKSNQELIKALKEVYGRLRLVLPHRSYPTDCTWAVKARAAIAKAEGGTNEL